MTADLSHISSVAKIDGFLPKDDGLKNALTGADIVVIPAGIPRKPTSTTMAKQRAHKLSKHDTQASPA